MSASPQIHPQPVDYLLRELARAKDRNRRNQLRANKLEASRDRWKARALRRGL